MSSEQSNGHDSQVDKFASSDTVSNGGSNMKLQGWKCKEESKQLNSPGGNILFFVRNSRAR